MCSSHGESAVPVCAAVGVRDAPGQRSPPLQVKCALQVTWTAVAHPGKAPSEGEDRL